MCRCFLHEVNVRAIRTMGGQVKIEGPEQAPGPYSPSIPPGRIRSMPLFHIRGCIRYIYIYTHYIYIIMHIVYDIIIYIIISIYNLYIYLDIYTIYIYIYVYVIVFIYIYICIWTCAICFYIFAHI